MNMTAMKKEQDAPKKTFTPLLQQDSVWYNEDYFVDALSRERKRTGRSRKPMALMLVDIDGIQDRHVKKDVAHKTARLLTSMTRETDIKGWYRQDTVLGVIFTEMNGVDPQLLRKNVEEGICASLPSWHRELISLSCHVFPEECGKQQAAAVADLALYPDLPKNKRSRRTSFAVKRAMDIVGSIVGLLLFSPLFFVIPLVIKLSSKGPVLFRQERIGQYGRPFQFLKFRSMQVNNDASVHQEYIEKFINGKPVPDGTDGVGGARVYKLTGDARITPVGEVLRKTSMDELPQFINVLRGDMSLVGPRPPIAYEVKQYDIWHRRRIMEIRPGITGLWQVKGRSTTTFDEMVRLDLQYAREWSVWMDVKILLKTPWAVIHGKGAY